MVWVPLPEVVPLLSRFARAIIAESGIGFGFELGNESSLRRSINDWDRTHKGKSETNRAKGGGFEELPLGIALFCSNNKNVNKRKESVGELRGWRRGARGAIRKERGEYRVDGLQGEAEACLAIPLLLKR